MIPIYQSQSIQFYIKLFKSLCQVLVLLVNVQNCTTEITKKRKYSVNPGGDNNDGVTIRKRVQEWTEDDGSDRRLYGNTSTQRPRTD